VVGWAPGAVSGWGRRAASGAGTATAVPAGVGPRGAAVDVGGVRARADGDQREGLAEPPQRLGVPEQQVAAVAQAPVQRPMSARVVSRLK
jgi:hypothetical protein